MKIFILVNIMLDTLSVKNKVVKLLFMRVRIQILHVLCQACDGFSNRNLQTMTKIGLKCVFWLQIVLFEHTTIEDFQNISFPELLEIRGFLVLFRVYGLTSLSRLFPNLVLIRGLDLLTDYALIIFDMPHLQEVRITTHHNFNTIQNVRRKNISETVELGGTQDLLQTSCIYSDTILVNMSYVNSSNFLLCNQILITYSFDDSNERSVKTSPPKHYLVWLV